MGKLVEETTLKNHKGRIWNVAWHPKGSMFVTAGEDKTIRIWGMQGEYWRNKAILSDGHKRSIREVCWSPDGHYLASASFDATTAIWTKNLSQYECVATLEGHENEVKSVAWSSSGALLATASRDKSVWVWEVTGDEEFDCAAVLNSHAQDVKRVIWHPHKDILASCSYDNTIKLYAENPIDNDWDCTATLESHLSTVWAIDFSPDGERLVSVSSDKTLKIWQSYAPGNVEGIPTPDKETVYKCVCTISGEHTRDIYDVSWCKSTGLIATACGDDAIRIFKEDDNSLKNEPTFSLVARADKAHEQDVNAVKWNPGYGRTGMLISCSDDGTAKIWKFVE